MIIRFPAARPQPRPAPDDFVAAHRRAWAMLRLSWRRRQAELASAAAADAEREQEIEAHRQRLVHSRIRAERTIAWNSMRMLIGARTPAQVRHLEIQRGIA